MLICIKLSEFIIYCKYARKFSVFEVICYIFLYYTISPIHSSLTYKRRMRDKPSLKILVSAINLSETYYEPSRTSTVKFFHKNS